MVHVYAGYRTVQTRLDSIVYVSTRPSDMTDKAPSVYDLYPLTPGPLPTSLYIPVYELGEIGSVVAIIFLTNVSGLGFISCIFNNFFAGGVTLGSSA